MFAGRFSSSLGMIGIDFGTRGVKLLQVREHGGLLHVVGAARLDVPLARVSQPPRTTSSTPTTPRPEWNAASAGDSAASQVDVELLAQQFREAFAAGGFSGRRCNVSLAREDICLQSIRLPRMPDDELRQTALWEASQRFGFDRNAMQVDFIRTGALAAGATGPAGQGSEPREEVILVAASHAAINARLEPVLQAGLRPVAVEAPFTAVVRALSRKVRREADRSIVRALVEIGCSGSSVLITRGDQIALCKPIHIGGAHLNRAVAEHLQMEEAAAAELRAARVTAAVSGQTIRDHAADRAVYEAVRPLMGDLVKEVTLCLRYYGVTFRGNPPETITLTGGDGLEPHLGEMLHKSCKIAVNTDDPSGTMTSLIGGVHTSLNRTPGPTGCWTVATGLSLRGLGRRAIRREAAKPVVAASAAGREGTGGTGGVAA